MFHVRLPPDGNNDTQDKQEKQETGKTKGHLVVRPNSVQKTNRQVTHYLIKHLQKNFAGFLSDDFACRANMFHIYNWEMTYLCYNLPQTISERYFSAFNFKFTVCLEYKIQCKFFLLISFFSKFLIYDVLYFSIHYSVRILYRGGVWFVFHIYNISYWCFVALHV